MGTRQKSYLRREKLKRGYPTKDPKTGQVTVHTSSPSTKVKGGKRGGASAKTGQAMRAHDAAAIQERLRVGRKIGAYKRGD